MRRKPAVAGTFYPARPEDLRREVGECLGSDRGDEPAVAILVPHAGYVYSGRCAGATYSRIRLPELVVLLGPNHTGLGERLAVVEEGSWQTPLGDAPIDASLARRLRALDPDLRHDPLAHAREHSLEVQVPFLQTLQPGLRFVPVSVGTRRPEELLALGDALAAAVQEWGEDILIVISSDMSHYIPFDEARARDAAAIERMEALDPEGLQAVVESQGITMCGYLPAIAGIRAARALGASGGRLVAYTSSAERTGDASDVVAYAGLIFN